MNRDGGTEDPARLSGADELASIDICAGGMTVGGKSRSDGGYDYDPAAKEFQHAGLLVLV
jgi:hypothetical protein